MAGMMDGPSKQGIMNEAELLKLKDAREVARARADAAYAAAHEAASAYADAALAFADAENRLKVAKAALEAHAKSVA